MNIIVRLIVVTGNAVFKSKTEFYIILWSCCVYMCACAAGWVSTWCLQVRGGSVCLVNVGVDWAVTLLGEERGLWPGTTSLLP